MITPEVSTNSQAAKDLEGGSSKRVLYVDDLRELREVATLALSRCGHTVDTACDGAEGLAKVTANPGLYDIVISDHHMTGMNGIELVMGLRALKYPGTIAIVSSELNQDVEEEYRSLGVDRILYKPVALHDLRDLVLES
jgi:CheY-like chemotaxis protein